MDMKHERVPKKKLFRNPILRFLSSIKFAIPVLFIFAMAMAWGTICESRFGTGYAQRAIYHSWWFYAIQGCMALSIILSFADRLPFKRRLTGFYMIHLALIVMLAGSVVTHLWGIDGQIELGPDSASRHIRLNEDFLYVFDSHGQQVKVALPYSANATSINHVLRFPNQKTITLKTFLPFAAPKRTWVAKKGVWHAKWQLKNANFGQAFEFWEGTLKPLRKHDLGPMRIRLIPESLFEGYTRLLKHQKVQFLLYHKESGTRFSVRDLKKPFTVQQKGQSYQLFIHKNKKLGLTAYRLKGPDRTYVYFPQYSEYPVGQDLKEEREAPFLFMDLRKVQQKNTLFFTRSTSKNTMRVLYGKGTSWTESTDEKPIVLPWMGFTLSKAYEATDRVIQWQYEPGTPQKKEVQNMSALLLEVNQKGHAKKSYWVHTQGVTDIVLGDTMYKAYVGPRLETLPFQMKLKEFKMDMIPGTQKPATFESFVTVNTKKEPVHIYMNNPYNAAGYTFYQSSYYKDDKGSFHSILSVNKDPGRGVKYGGALLLILGLIIHFLVLYGYIRVGHEKLAR